MSISLQDKVILNSQSKLNKKTKSTKKKNLEAQENRKIFEYKHKKIKTHSRMINLKFHASCLKNVNNFKTFVVK